ncbi:MAG: 4Fe-4S binding protein [Promethearchaeota archaeon]
MVKRLMVKDADLCVGCQSCMFACTRRPGGAERAGVEYSAIHVRSAGGIKNGFLITVCRACRDPPCARVCPTGALRLRKKGGGVVLRPEKCLACGNCTRACGVGAIGWNDSVDKPLICVHCGYCSSYCPYGVLKMKEVKEAAV